MSRSRKETAQNTTPPDGGDKIATLAYSLWIDRGCPDGSPEQDLYEAERMLTAPLSDRATKRKVKAAGA